MKRRTRRWIALLVATGVLAALAVGGAYYYQNHRLELALQLAPAGFNSEGGDITITNARIWTGDKTRPWADAVTVKDGKIVALDARSPQGRVVDAGGRLVVPGLWDAHTHPHAPYVLNSPEAPTLFGAKSPEEVLERLREYVEEHPEDKFPRMFGWMSTLFKDGRKPTRQEIDAVVSDRPVYLVCNDGHSHWANTKALELAGVLEKDPPDMRGDGYIQRDPKTGLATGYMEETEYASTAGVMLNAVKKLRPYTLEQEASIQRVILDEYSKVGVTSIYAKGGYPEITDVYEYLLANDRLPVRATLNNMYTPYSKLSDIAVFKERADKLTAAGHPSGFLRADVLKVFIDLPKKGWIWMHEPYADGSGSGKPAYPLEDFTAQVLEGDKLGLQVNVSVYGDKALTKTLDVFERVMKQNPERERRHTVEHGEYVQPSDIGRYKKLGVIASMNWLESYPDVGFQQQLQDTMGKTRQDTIFQHFRDIWDAGAIITDGGDFPLGPMDPMVAIQVLTTGKDIYGKPDKGLWPEKTLTVEEALIAKTANPAFANFSEDRLGKIKKGYDADFVVLSGNILDPGFDKAQIAWVKSILTIMNGHVTHEDFTDAKKEIDFQK